MRIHSKIARQPFARLWYLLRAFDFKGQGYGEISVSQVCQILKISTKSLYRWLKQGKQIGAFRRYSLKKNALKTWLGSLHKTCHGLGLKDWGAVGIVPLAVANDFLRSVATTINTQDLQEKSHYAATTNLKQKYRSFYAPPKAEAIIALSGTFQKPNEGDIPFLLHVGQRRAFVSKGFIPFGTSQKSIGNSLDIHPVTVRRHQLALNVERRQIMQAKFEYGTFLHAIKLDTDYCAQKDSILTKTGNGYSLTEPLPNLLRKKQVKKSRHQKPTFYKSVTAETFCRYWDKVWIYRCNLYKPIFQLTSMRYSRSLYKRLLNPENPPRRIADDGYDYYGNPLENQEIQSMDPFEGKRVKQLE